MELVTEERTMHSVVIEKPGQLVIQQRPLPQPAANEVRVKIKFAGICGSDVHIYHGHNPFARYPRVIGHEFFGVIDQVGCDVDPQRIGERVAVDPVVSCGHCYPCSIGRPNVCTELQVIGVHRDGGFSDYACAPARNAYRIPHSISDRHAAMVEPFTIGANITAHLQPTADDIALIYGAGPMGLTVIQTLKGVYGGTYRHHGLLWRGLHPDPAKHHQQGAVDFLLTPKQRTLPAGHRLDGQRQNRSATINYPLRVGQRG